MKVGNLPAVLIILFAAFAIAFAASRFVYIGPNGTLLVGGINLQYLPCNYPGQSCPNITVTSNPIDMTINASVNIPLNQTSVINVTLPPHDGSATCVGTTIQFISDIGKFNKTTCAVTSPSCYCSVIYTSSQAGTATIIAQDTNITNYANGETNVYVTWPETPCIGGTATCDNFNTGDSCQKQSGCAWYGTTGCVGSNDFSCSSLSTITDCTSDYRCTWSSGSCVGRNCTFWNNYPDVCQTVDGCNYTTTQCSGTANSCDSLTDQSLCQNQTTCTWVGYNSNVETTTTTSTTTTTETTTTTTTPPAMTNFTANNFTCSNISSGFSCGLYYNNYLGEDAVAIFLFSNTNGDVVSSGAPTASQISNSTSTYFFCSAVPSGSYYVSWKAYRLSDSVLSNAVAWSKSSERQIITC